MVCPFLEITRVRYCGVSPYRKMVRQTSIHEVDQRCSTADYVNCPAAQGHLEGRTDLAQCPFLSEAEVQCCGAASVMKFVPASGNNTRCTTDAYCYCQHYLQRAQPRGGRADRSRDDDVPLAEGRAYARNHLWIDIGQGGAAHVGVDAFTTRALGEVESVKILSGQDAPLPSAVLRVRGEDLVLQLPVKAAVVESNVVLRARPQTLLADPYGKGWLFAARLPQADSPANAQEYDAAFLRGPKAQLWLQAELERVSRWLQTLPTREGAEQEPLMADGGIFSPGLALALDRRDLRGFFDRFFSSHSVDV